MSTSPSEAGIGWLSVADSLLTLIGGFIIGVSVDGVRVEGIRLEDDDVPTKGKVPTQVIKGLVGLDGVVDPVSAFKGIVVRRSTVISLGDLVRDVDRGKAVVLLGQGSVSPSRITNLPRVRVFGRVLGRTIRKEGVSGA